jgi:hypothetical protein
MPGQVLYQQEYYAQDHLVQLFLKTMYRKKKAGCLWQARLS